MFVAPFVFETLVLVKLLVTDCYNLRIKNHLVHLLHVVVLLVKLMLSLGKLAHITVFLLDLGLGGWHLVGSLPVHLLHALAARLSVCLLHLELLGLQHFLGGQVLLILDCCVGLNARDLCMVQNGCLPCGSLLRFLADLSQLFCCNHRCVLASRFV